MRKKRKVLALALAALLLGACNETPSDPSSSSSSYDSSDSSVIPDSSSSPSDSSSKSDDTSSSEEEKKDWSEEEKALMLKFCGSVLPHPGSKMMGKIIVREIEDHDYGNYLMIYNTADSFTLKEYYSDLVKSGWNLIKGYGGKAIQTDDYGVEFAELTNASLDKKTGYDLMYYWIENEHGTANNIIKCYNDMCGEKSDAVNWDADEKAEMIETLSIELPFIQLGSSNRAYAKSSSLFEIIDVYVEDLSDQYADILIKNGFIKDNATSAEYGSIVLNKALEDGSNIQAALYYLNGNTFDFVYLPKVDQYNAWPKEALAEIESKTGVTIPEFELDEGGKFYVFAKNDTFYIQGQTTKVASWDYEEELEAQKLRQMTYSSPYVNWEETIAVECDEIYADGSQIGFQVAITLTEPESSFTESFPADAINDLANSLFGMTDYSFPLLDGLADSFEGKIKYEVNGSDYVESRYQYYLKDIAANPDDYIDLPYDYTDKDIEELAKDMALGEAGITIRLKDKEESAIASAYATLFENLGYHIVDGWGDYYFEDKDGKLWISFNSVWYEEDWGFTTITIAKGSGETHTPTLEFSNETYEIGIGKTQKLQVYKDMLPYDVYYASSNPEKFAVNDKGFVTVSSSAVSGDKATIHVFITTPDGRYFEDTCVVTAKEILDYDADSTINKVLTGLKNNGFESAMIERDEDDDPFIKMTFDLSDETNVVTADSLISLTDSKLIPAGFEALYNMDADTDDECWGACDRYEDGIEIGKGKFLSCEFTYEDDEEPKVYLTFYVYTLNSNPDTLVFEVFANNNDFLY